MFPNGLWGFLVVGTDGKVQGLGSSGGGTWGSITGTLSSQTDLQTALNARLTVASGSWSPLTNGDPINPELIFDGNGDTYAVWT